MKKLIHLKKALVVVIFCVMGFIALTVLKGNSCDNLHKVTSRDDLLKQMYDTAFKDDCLYDMDPNELQAIWQVPLSDGRFRQAYTEEQIRNDSSLNLYPDKSPFDFYISHLSRVADYSRINNYFSITLTRDAWLSGKYTLFPEGHFPEYFGKPSITDIPYGLRSYNDVFLKSQALPHPDIMQSNKLYSWENGFIKKRSVEMWTTPNGAVTSVVFRKYYFD